MAQQRFSSWQSVTVTDEKSPRFGHAGVTQAAVDTDAEKVPVKWDSDGKTEDIDVTTIRTL